MNACIVIVFVVRSKLDLDKANSHPMRKVRTISVLSHPNELCACSSSKLTAAENCIANTKACNELGGSKPAYILRCQCSSSARKTDMSDYVFRALRRSSHGGVSFLLRDPKHSLPQLRAYRHVTPELCVLPFECLTVYTFSQGVHSYPVALQELVGKIFRG